MVKSRGSRRFQAKQRKYKLYNSIYCKCLTKAKTLHWKYVFEATKSDMKNTWENINTLLNRKKNTHSYPQTFISDDKELKTPVEIASGFNEYFTNIGPLLAENIPFKQKQPINFYPQIHFQIASSLPQPLLMRYQQ